MKTIEQFQKESFSIPLQIIWQLNDLAEFKGKQAYQEFEQRVGEVIAPHGEKTARIETAIETFAEKFSVADLHQACPGVSIDLIRTVLKRLQAENAVKYLGKGRSARWIRLN
jgi:hypothetical protein